MRANILIAVIATLIFGVLGIAAYNKQAPVRNPNLTTDGTSAGIETLNPNAPQSSTPAVSVKTLTKATPTKSTTSVTPAVKIYTMADVAKHSNSASCWTVVNGRVYDVTDWINQHPGGQQAILGMCGVDASGAFNGQHGGQARPVSELASFMIGQLAGATPATLNPTVPARSNQDDD